MEVDIENQKGSTLHSTSPSKTLSPLGMSQPLQPVSLERQNQQRIPQSPSLPIGLDSHGSPQKTHQHRLSDAADVRARVAYLNAISQPNSPNRSPSPLKSTSAAIQRAILGREEAESHLTMLTSQVDAFKIKERAEAEKVAGLQKQLEESHSRRTHERAVYEKEIRSVKKAEYKAELAVIKLQEELREARSELEGYRARSEHEKAEKEKARQEAFERAYVIAGISEELQDVKQKLEVAGQERDAAVAMAASKLAVEPTPTQQETSTATKVNAKSKDTMIHFSSKYFDEEDLEHPNCPIEIKHAVLQVEVEFLRRQVQQDAELVNFMNMSCQFKACPCRLAERDGVRFVHDYAYDAKLRAKNAKKRKIEGLDPQPQLPLRAFKSWRQTREEEAKKKDAEPRPTSGAKQASQQDLARHKPQDDEDKHEGKKISAVARQTKEVHAPLSPTEPVVVLSQSSDASPDELMEAANIPLPSLKPQEIDSSNATPEPTAQLEDLTQVLVEAGDSAQSFLFSLSTTSNRLPIQMESHSQPMERTRTSDNLFDISPPKRNIPPRPSTALGVLTVDSPVRLVPNSPLVLGVRSLTPDVDLARPITTRIALNDTSPVRHARQQRQHPKLHSKERLNRPPTLVTATDPENSQASAEAPTFPSTPTSRSERNNRDRHVGKHPPRPQTTLGHYQSGSTDVSRPATTTTSIPLRDNNSEHDYEDSVFDQESDAYRLRPNLHPSASGTPFSVPGTPNMTREQALAQIRARRDRARSINMRKSAESSGSKTPSSTARRGVNLKERLTGGAVENRGRDFSQASAPGRI